MEEKSNNTAKWIFGIVIGLITILCCCLIIAAAALYGFIQLGDTFSNTETPFEFGFDTSTATPTPIIEVTRTPIEDVPTDTLSILSTTIVPENNLNEIACRLEGKCNIPDTIPSGPFEIGDQKDFFVTNTDSNQNFSVTATLRYRADHTYFWVEDGVKYNDGDMKDLVDTFDQKIYQTNREFFGSERTPGIDNDPRIHILYVRGVGSNVLGLFPTADFFSPLIQEYSNAHEMFVFNADLARLSDPDTYGTLAHEFQHMIHWNLDRNETSWINEGSSVLAEFLNNYDVGFDWYYIQEPNTQLNTWPSDHTLPHYGAGFLYVNYFLNRFGEEATQTLIRNPLNGLASVDDTLAQINATDPLTGQPITADDLFADWAVTNYLLDPKVGDGRFDYANYPAAIRANETESISNCPQTGLERSVHQYGVDYIQITCKGDHTLTFTGSTATRILPVDPYSGDYAFWSNTGDESDMTLTREFDLSNVNGPVEISYRTWYDIEEDYDYLYLEASTDGQNWQILTTPSGTAEDPSGNSFGWGYNAQSNGWIEETVDLSQYAGQKVWLRFEYITDAGVNGEGFLLDNVSIPTIDYFEDFETSDGGWLGEGFVRIQNTLPQTYRVTLIKEGRNPGIEYITLTNDQTAEIPISIGGDVDSVVLVVSGTTRFTRENAFYRLDIR